MMNAKERSRDLKVEVVEILGSCPVYRLGDRFSIIEGYKLISGQPICMHASQAFGADFLVRTKGVGCR